MIGSHSKGLTASMLSYHVFQICNIRLQLYQSPSIPIILVVEKDRCPVMVVNASCSKEKGLVSKSPFWSFITRTWREKTLRSTEERYTLYNLGANVVAWVRAASAAFVKCTHLSCQNSAIPCLRDSIL